MTEKCKAMTHGSVYYALYLEKVVSTNNIWHNSSRPEPRVFTEELKPIRFQNMVSYDTS